MPMRGAEFQKECNAAGCSLRATELNLKKLQGISCPLPRLPTDWQYRITLLSATLDHSNASFS